MRCLGEQDLESVQRQNAGEDPHHLNQGVNQVHRYHLMEGGGGAVGEWIDVVIECAVTRPDLLQHPPPCPPPESLSQPASPYLADLLFPSIEVHACTAEADLGDHYGVHCH